VKECSVHGAALHILLDSRYSLGSLKEFTGLSPMVITPTLEDVFISLSKTHRQ